MSPQHHHVRHTSKSNSEVIALKTQPLLKSSSAGNRSSMQEALQEVHIQTMIPGERRKQLLLQEWMHEARLLTVMIFVNPTQP